MTLISVAEILLLQAPLLSFVYYGFFSDNMAVIGNILSCTVNKDSLTVIVFAVQILLTVAFMGFLFFFISKVLKVFLKNERLIFPYYLWFFGFSIFLPVILTFLSLFLKVKLGLFVIVISVLFNIFIAVMLIFTKKILPETTDAEYRKYLFRRETENE